jgi:sec-independent protein translocase protein TatA
MPSIGPMELIVVMVIALLILGPKRLPEVGRSVGHGMRSFKDAVTGGGGDDESNPAEVPEKAAQA